MQSLLADAADRAARYLDTLQTRPVSPSASDLEALEGFFHPLQHEPMHPAQVLEELDSLGSPATVATAGGRFFGFVIGGSLPAPLAANMLAGAWDQNAWGEIASPVGAALEKVCRDWLKAIFGLPPETEVGFVSGATMANFTDSTRMDQLHMVNVANEKSFFDPTLNIISLGQFPDTFSPLRQVTVYRSDGTKAPADYFKNARGMPHSVPGAPHWSRPHWWRRSKMRLATRSRTSVRRRA